MDRRRFIVAGAWIGAAVFTGCSGGDNGTTTTEGEGDQTTELETTTEPEGTTTEPKTTTEAEETTTESEETTTEAEETTTEPETTTDEETTTEEGPGEEISFGGLYTIEQNYAADIEIDDQAVEDPVKVRHYGDDYYQHIEFADGYVVEIYHVDNDDYAVIDDCELRQCFVDPGEEVTRDSEVDSDAEEYGSKPDVDLEPSGTDEITYKTFYVDEPVYVFEVSGPDVEGVLIFYVSESTGYPLRIEADWGVINFHSWGEVDPISPPDMDCQQYPG